MTYRIDEDDLNLQSEWSFDTFGPGPRLKGVLSHIRKELKEIENEPQDISEWADLLILSFDGALRQGFTGRDIIKAYWDKAKLNREREWPDWEGSSQDEAIEHIRS